MSRVDLPVPHFTDGVAEAQRLVDDRSLTPELAEPDRQFLGDMLKRLRKAIVQRGAVEFDVAHAPAEVSRNYPDLDRGLLVDCRTLALAMVAAWRWNRDDQFPDRHRVGTDLLRHLKALAG